MMSQTYFCDCLNVNICGELAGQQEVNYAGNLIDSISDQIRGDFSQLFKTSTLLTVKSADDIKITHSYLSLKRNISNWQINFCAVCEKETHAVLYNDGDFSGLVLVSSHCSNNIHKMKMIMDDPEFSVIFGILIKGPYRTPIDISSKTLSGDLMVEPAMAMSISEVEMEASAKVKQSLYIERLKMEELIKDFVRIENSKYEDLCESAQKEKNNFLMMVKAINQRHEMIDYSFDKENSSNVNVETINYSHEKKEDFFLSEEASMFEFTTDNVSKQTEDISFSKQKPRSADFDGLFDIDDIECEANNKHLKEEELFDDDEDHSHEEEDLFPVNLNDSEANDKVAPLAESGMNFMSSTDANMRTRMMASSVIQNIPLTNQSETGNSQLHPNSLPILIPRHMSKALTELEDNKADPNDSIADRIQKLARSVRNVPEFVDNRPRRRLNTFLL